jgi:hypothetical protein
MKQSLQQRAVSMVGWNVHRVDLSSENFVPLDPVDPVQGVPFMSFASRLSEPGMEFHVHQIAYMEACWP